MSGAKPYPPPIHLHGAHRNNFTFIVGNCQSFWLQIQRSRVRFPALPDFLSSSGSGKGSTQPREVKLRSYSNKKVAAPGSENRD